MRWNHSQAIPTPTPPLCLWKNCLQRNQSLAPNRFGTAVLKHSAFSDGASQRQVPGKSLSNWEKTLGLVRFGDGERMRVWYGSDRVCVCAQPSPTLCDPMDCSPPGSSLHGIDFPGKNTGVGCNLLLQGIFPTQGSNPRLLSFLHWQADSLPLNLGSQVWRERGHKMNRDREVKTSYLRDSI